MIRQEQAEVLGFQDSVLQDALRTRRYEVESTLRQVCAERHELTSKPGEDFSQEKQRHKHRQFILSKEIEVKQNHLDKERHRRDQLEAQLKELEIQVQKENFEDARDLQLVGLKNQITRQEMKLQEVQLMNKEYKEMVSLFETPEMHEKRLEEEKRSLKQANEEYKQQAEARKDISLALETTVQEYEEVKQRIQQQQQQNKHAKDAKRYELRELHAEREFQGNQSLNFDDYSALTDDSAPLYDTKLLATRVFENQGINPQQFLSKTQMMLQNLDDEVIKKLQYRTQQIDQLMNNMKTQKLDNEIPLVVSCKKFDDSVRKIMIHRTYMKDKHAQTKQFFESIINNLQIYIEKLQIIRPVSVNHHSANEAQQALLLHSCFGFDQLDKESMSIIEQADLICFLINSKLENCTSLCNQLSKSQIRMPTIEATQDEIKEDDLGLEDSDDLPVGASLQSIHNVRIQLPDLQPEDFQVDGLLIQKALSFRGMRQLLKNESSMKLAELSSKKSSKLQ